MLGSLLADTAAVLLLALAPVVGSALVLGLLAIYTMAGVGVHAGDGSCRCFWRIMNTSTAGGFVVRNVLLAAIASIALVAPRETGTAEFIVAVSYLALVTVSARVLDRWWMSRDVSASSEVQPGGHSPAEASTAESRRIDAEPTNKGVVRR